MTSLVAGATGATGRLLVQQLLERGHHVRVIVRSAESLPEAVRTHARLSLTQGSILELAPAELQAHVRGCDAVASCLGHNLSWRGVFGPPHRLVTDAARRLCEAIRAVAPARPTRYVLMNTTGNQNRDLAEPRSAAERAVFAMLRLALPPHVDNEQAAEYLRAGVGRNDPLVEWTAVRPDSLADHEAVSAYDVVPSPTRSPLFNSGTTSRINVAHFMAALMSEDDLWSRWKFQMPVIYNRGTA